VIKLLTILVWFACAAVIGALLGTAIFAFAPPANARSLSFVCEGSISHYSITYTLIARKNGDSNSCVFVTNSAEGKKILQSCPMGSRCFVEAAVDNTGTYNKIYNVMSVHRIGMPALDARAEREKESEEQRRWSAIRPYEEKTTACVVNHILNVPQDAVRDVLFSTPCAQERNALAAEYIKQFGPRGSYLYIDYEKKLLDIVDLEKSRAKSQER